MCLPTLFAIIIISVFAVYLVFLGLAAFAHYFLHIPLATNILNYLLKRRSGVLDVCGRPVTFTHKASGGNGPSSLELVLTGKFHARAAFYTETKLDRIGKDLGLNKEIQLNDPAFDQAVYIDCDDNSFVNTLLDSPEAKEKLRTLLGVFTSLEFKGDRCVLRKTPCDDPDEVGMQEMAAAALNMLALADHIIPPAPGQKSLTPLSENRRHLEFLLTAGGVALLLCGALTTFWGIYAFEPLAKWQAFRTSLPAALAFESIFLSYMYLRVKGTAAGLRAFRKGLLSGGIGIILWCWGWLLVLNGSQDLSPAVRHEVNVLSKHVSSGRGGGFTIGLSSWPGAESYTFKVRRKEFDLVEVGDNCVVSVKKGYFGFEWIDGKVCQGRGRYVGSGNVGVASENAWRLLGGYFREIPAPVPQ